MARFLHLPSPDEIAEEDPLAGIANLFDVSIVFIVGLMLTLFSVYRMSDLVDSKSEVTMVKTNAQGEREIIVKKGTQITAYKVTGRTAAGVGWVGSRPWVVSKPVAKTSSLLPPPFRV